MECLCVLYVRFAPYVCGICPWMGGTHVYLRSLEYDIWHLLSISILLLSAKVSHWTRSSSFWLCGLPSWGSSCFYSPHVGAIIMSNCSWCFICVVGIWTHTFLLIKQAVLPVAPFRQPIYYLVHWYSEFSSLVETNTGETKQSEPAISVASNVAQNTEVFHSKCGNTHFFLFFCFIFSPNKCYCTQSIFQEPEDIFPQRYSHRELTIRWIEQRICHQDVWAGALSHI